MDALTKTLILMLAATVCICTTLVHLTPGVEAEQAICKEWRRVK